MSQKRNASVAFIFVTLLLDTLGVGLIVPVLPSLLGSLVGGDLVAASRYYGLFIALYAAMQVVFAPILGGLSDRFGRRRVLLGSLLGAGLDYILLALAPTLPWLFVGRLISGITGASFSTATAYIADVTPPERRAQSFGLVGAAFGLGFIIGPAVGGALGGVHPRLPFAVAAGLNLLNFLYGLFVLPESLPPENRRPFTLRRANPLVSVGRLLQNPAVSGLVGTMACGYLAQQILQAVWALHGEQRYRWTTAQIGLSLTLVGITSAIVQGGLIRALMPRLGERRALVLALVTSASGYVGLGLASRPWMAYAIMIPFALGGLAGPAVQAILSKAVPASEQGELQGSLTSLNSLAAIVGPIVGTSLLARFGAAGAVPHVAGAPFLFAAALQLLGLTLALRDFRLRPASGAAG